VKPALSLLEGKWSNNTHMSVRDLFGPLFTVWATSPESSCHYEQFTNVAAFRSAIGYAFRSHRANVIYIGAHGDDDRIQGFHDDGISRSVIKNALNREEGSTKRGVFFGACGFVQERNARFILLACPRVTWMGGYASSIDWVDSSALDLCFMRHVLFPRPGRGNRRPRTLAQKVEFAVARIREDMEPMAVRLGFHVFVRRGSRIVDLMATN